APMIAGLQEAATMDALAAPIMLLVLTLGLLVVQLDFISRPTGAIVPGVLLAAGVGVLATALMATGFDGQRRKPNNLEYIADATHGQAYWVSVDPEPDEWTRHYLGDEPARGSLP